MLNKHFLKTVLLFVFIILLGLLAVYSFNYLGEGEATLINSEQN